MSADRVKAAAPRHTTPITKTATRIFVRERSPLPMAFPHSRGGLPCDPSGYGYSRRFIPIAGGGALHFAAAEAAQTLTRGLDRRVADRGAVAGKDLGGIGSGAGGER